MTQLLTRGELIKLCAVDSGLFSRVYFPKSVRQASPSFDEQLWAALENPAHRFLNMRVFRGGSKTTKLRLFAAKRIAYGISRTILYIGASESHALRSVQWLRSRIAPGIGMDGVPKPSEFAQTFGLRPGAKWQEHEFEVYHGVDDVPIWVMGVGVTGTIRGINFDDYRPDLIIVDDVITDENAATKAAAEKISDLILNAVANSLASEEEFPNAKLVMLQTPISDYDISVQAESDPEWHTESFGCWTKETEDLPIDEQVSSWPEMFPTERLRSRKRNAIARRRYSGFSREMECKVVQSEESSFDLSWLRFYEEPPAPGTCVIAIDPVPPPTETQRQKGEAARKGDFEAISVVSRSGGNYYLLDYATSRGHEPQWTATKMFEFALRYRPLCIIVESVSAQRYLAWFLRQEMIRRRRFYYLKESPNRQASKFSFIVTSLNGVASAGRLYCSPEHTEFILQFEKYGLGYRGPDDLIDSVAIGISELVQPTLELGAEDYAVLDEVEPWPKRRNAP